MKKNILTGLILLISLSLASQSKARFRKEVTAFYPVNDVAFSYDKELPLTFLWTDTALLYAPYRFLLFSEGQKEPIYDNKEVPVYYLDYPWNAPELKEGKYSWMAISQRNGMQVGGSFTISNREVPQSTFPRKQNYYTEPEEVLSGYLHSAFDKKLPIRYTHIYHNSKLSYLKFRITDDNQTVIAESKEDGTVPPHYLIPDNPMPFRENFIRINLESCPGIVMEKVYTLDVWNEKNEHLYLRFLCNYSFPLPIWIPNP